MSEPLIPEDITATSFIIVGVVVMTLVTTIILAYGIELWRSRSRRHE